MAHEGDEGRTGGGSMNECQGNNGGYHDIQGRGLRGGREAGGEGGDSIDLGHNVS